MKRSATVMSLVLLSVLQLFSQTIISGCVKFTNGEGVDMANVSVLPYSMPGTVIASTFTAVDGSFSIKVNSLCDSVVLKVSGMGLLPATVAVPNKQGTHTIVVEGRDMELKEVVVKAKKIYSQEDTINYNVASFLSQSDQSVADVLRKMPGITVSEAGQVSYQGKPIKNLYIEGLDLMKGHYGIATNSIDPNSIATVQVFENHQDIKALKGLRPEEQASINLRLKEGVKGVYNLIAVLGSGYGGDVLWVNSVIATCFRRKSQFLATYKGNNTGEDLSQELYSLDNDYSRTNNISSIVMPSAPGIDKRYYYFNRSHSATFNNVYRVGKSGVFGINAAYLNDRDSRECYSSTSNTLPGGSQNIVDELVGGKVRMQKAYGDLTYMDNGERNYLKGQLKFDWGRNDADSRILAGVEDIGQLGKTDTYRLLNKFHMTCRNSESRGFEIYSLVNLEKRPHSLVVSPNLFPDLFTDGVLNQNVDYRNISTENRFGFLSAFRYGNFSLHPTAIFNYHHNSLDSDIAQFRNRLALDYIDAGMNAEFVYSIRRFHVSLCIPFKYRLFSLDNKHDDEVTDKSRFRVSPDLSITYDINSSHHLTLKSVLNHLTPSIENLYSNYILTSYRCLSAYDVSGLYEGAALYNSISYSFKNILSMSFAGVEAGWHRELPDVLYGSYYDGLVQRTISRRTSETGDMFSVKVHASRGFDWRRFKIGLSATYTCYDNPLLVQDEVLRYTGSSLGVDADISVSPFRWLSALWEGRYYQSAGSQKGCADTPWLRTVTNKASLDFAIPGGVTLKASVYHYYNNFNDGDKSFVLLNAEARYSIKRFIFTLACDNLLDRKAYLYSSRSALTDTRSVYNIRPRSVVLKIRLRIF